MRQIGSIMLLVLGVFQSTLFAQVTDTYFIQFKDKEPYTDVQSVLSTKSLERRKKYNIMLDEYDTPVSTKYINGILEDTSIYIRYTLKWHNALVVNCSQKSIELVSLMPYVKAVRYVGKSTQLTAPQRPLFDSPKLMLKDSEMKTSGYNKDDYGVSYLQNEQIGIPYLHKLGYTGQGIDVAVFDAGFKNINAIPGFLKHQANNKLTIAFDVAEMDNELTSTDNHGTAVTSCLGAYELGKYIGTAPLAHLFLFRTEFGATEYPLEELNWCKAAELADSAGVDMITSSLGYNRFDDSTLNYTHEDLDGLTSYVSLGARIAVEKGILVLNSAGNEGDNKWRKIGTPADAATVLTIGAVDTDDKVGTFSSQGYNAKGDIKPDVSACGVLTYVSSPSGNYYQGYGTSYATPVAAGGVACLLQAFPLLNPLQINQLIRVTATQANNPDSITGYGVAQFDAAYKLQQLQMSSTFASGIIKVNEDRLIVYNPNKQPFSYKIYTKANLLGFIPYKKNLDKGISKNLQTVAHIAFSSPADCTKKYTVILKFHSNSGIKNLVKHDIKLCSY